MLGRYVGAFQLRAQRAVKEGELHCARKIRALYAEKEGEALTWKFRKILYEYHEAFCTYIACACALLCRAFSRSQLFASYENGIYRSNVKGDETIRIKNRVLGIHKMLCKRRIIVASEYTNRMFLCV